MKNLFQKETALTTENEKLKSQREIERRISDLWLGGFIRHFEARKALEILRQQTEGEQYYASNSNEDTTLHKL